MLSNILGWPNSSLRFFHTVDITSLVTAKKYAIARLVVFWFFFSKLMVREDLRPGQNVRFTGFVKIPNLSCRKVIHKTSLQQRGTHVTLFLPVTGNNMGTQNNMGAHLLV